MGQEVKDHLRRALSLMLKPLVRLLIAQGVTHAEFSETAKEVYVETALRHFETEGKVNKSRVAILTGLTRKEVKNVIDRALTTSYKEKTHSRPARVLTGWYSDPGYQGPYGIPLELPYDSGDGEGPSFVELVKNYSGDMIEIVVDSSKENLTAGVIVENTGNIHIRFGGILHIYNKDGEPIANIKLKQGNPVYPGKTRLYYGNIPNFRIPDGKYTVDGVLTDIDWKVRHNIEKKKFKLKGKVRKISIK